AKQLAMQIEAMPPIAPEGFRAVLPMNDLERAIFAFQAEVWHAQGKPPLRVWHTHRWDYLAPSDEPTDQTSARLSVRMMNGEARADVLNFTNASAKDTTLHLQLQDLPGGTNPAYLTLREVLHTGTRHFVSVAAALPEVKKDSAAWVLSVPRGMTI